MFTLITSLYDSKRVVLQTIQFTNTRWLRSLCRVLRPLWMLQFWTCCPVWTEMPYYQPSQSLYNTNLTRRRRKYPLLISNALNRQNCWDYGRYRILYLRWRTRVVPKPKRLTSWSIGSRRRLPLKMVCQVGRCHKGSLHCRRANACRICSIEIGRSCQNLDTKP